MFATRISSPAESHELRLRCSICGVYDIRNEAKSDPTFEGLLTNEADKLEQPWAKIQQTSASAN
jgi:hypothetical protein